jgi:hypothetical protein
MVVHLDSEDVLSFRSRPKMIRSFKAEWRRYMRPSLPWVSM